MTQDRPRRTALYRLYNARNELIYVGVTWLTFPVRMRGHAYVQPWWDEVARATVVWYETREKAEAAETEAIAAERPKYNKAKRQLEFSDVAPPGIPRYIYDLDYRIARARRMRGIGVDVVPSLLQTPQYARCVLDMWSCVSECAVDLDEAVVARMRRQEALYEPGREFQFVIAEHVLRSPWIGGFEVTLGQLSHLEYLSRLKNVTLGIVPVPAASPRESFLILDDQVIIESFKDRISSDSAAACNHQVDQFMSHSVSGMEARRLIRIAAGHLEEMYASCGIEMIILPPRA